MTAPQSRKHTASWPVSSCWCGRIVKWEGNESVRTFWIYQIFAAKWRKILRVMVQQAELNHLERDLSLSIRRDPSVIHNRWGWRQRTQWNQCKLPGCLLWWKNPLFLVVFWSLPPFLLCFGPSFISMFVVFWCFFSAAFFVSCFLSFGKCSVDEGIGFVKPLSFFPCLLSLIYIYISHLWLPTLRIFCTPFFWDSFLTAWRGKKGILSWNSIL